MNLFDQRKEDPRGFYGSIAAICLLFAVGALMTGGTAGPIGLIAAVAAAGFWWRARQ